MKKTINLTLIISLLIFSNCGVVGTAVGGDLQDYDAEYTLILKSGKTINESLDDLEHALVENKLKKQDEINTEVEDSNLKIKVVSYTKTNMLEGIAIGKHTIIAVTATIIDDGDKIDLSISVSTNMYSSGQKENKNLYEKILASYNER